MEKQEGSHNVVFVGMNLPANASIENATFLLQVGSKRVYMKPISGKTAFWIIRV